MAHVGPYPQYMVCPECRTHIRTTVRYKSTTRTHLVALILCFCLCWPCVCLPYCLKSCKNANHYCPNCGTYIGTYYR